MSHSSAALKTSRHEAQSELDSYIQAQDAELLKGNPFDAEGKIPAFKARLESFDRAIEKATADEKEASERKRAATNAAFLKEAIEDLKEIEKRMIAETTAAQAATEELTKHLTGVFNLGRDYDAKLRTITGNSMGNIPELSLDNILNRLSLRLAATINQIPACSHGGLGVIQWPPMRFEPGMNWGNDESALLRGLLPSRLREVQEKIRELEARARGEF